MGGHRNLRPQRIPLAVIARARELAARRWPTGDDEHGGPLATRPVPPGALFVTGCQRSGTTVLTRLLQSHPAVALGMERYKFVVRRMRTRPVARRVCPSHFEPARFFDFRPTDTNIIPPQFEEYYRQTAARYRSDELRYVGDKVQPPHPKVFRRLADRFPDARYVFVHRDPLEVASSFEVRARDPEDSWPADHGYQLAVHHWNTAFAAMDDLERFVGPDRVHVVRHQDLFGGDLEPVAAMFGFLGLEVTPSVTDFHAVRTAGWRERPARPSALDADQQAWVRAEIDPAAAARFAALAPDD